jgi:hypothetical protein
MHQMMPHGGASLRPSGVPTRPATALRPADVEAET